VYGFTSTTPSLLAIFESNSSLCGLLGGLMHAVVKSFSIVSPLSTFLNVAIFCPISFYFTDSISHPKKTSIPLLWHWSNATSLAYGNL
jgi:hypothetical protein